MMNLEMMIAEGEAVFSNCYGVKASKAKHRKNRKAKRLESRKHKHTGYNRNADKDFDRYGKILVQNREKALFKGNFLNILAEAEEEDAEYLATEKAKAEAEAERIRIANMSDAEKVEKRNILMDALAKKALYLNRPCTFETERGKFWFEEIREYGWTDSWLTGVKLFKLTNGNVEPVYTIWQEETDTEEEVKPRSMEEMIEDMVKII